MAASAHDLCWQPNCSGHLMTAQASESPLALLEQSLIDEYLRLRGCEPDRLRELPAVERDALLKAASLYASGKLSEVETRSHYMHELHDAIGDVPKPSRR
jgi:hypothetical protein